MIRSRKSPPLHKPQGRITRAWFVLLVLILTATICGAQSTVTLVETPNPPNAAAQLSKHYVVLVSLDGFPSQPHGNQLGSSMRLSLESIALPPAINS